MNLRESVVFLLGAGFSAPLGVPTMQPFFQDFLAFSRKRYPELQSTLDELLMNLGEDADLEALLATLNSAVEVENAALPPNFDKSQLEGWIEDAKAIRAHLLAYIVERCEQFDRRGAEQSCGPFFTSISDGAIVFTTNYDRVSEYVCDTLELPWTDGFESGKVVSPWTGEFNSPLALAKLHGSVTWYTDSTGPTEYLRLDRGYPLPGPDFRLSRRGSALDPLMIIPTLEKQTLGPPYNQLQNFFADSLSKAKLLVVIGSSLRDDHLVGAVEFRRESLTVLLVGRQSRDTARRLQNVVAVPLEADSEAFLRFGLDPFSTLRQSVAELQEKDAVDIAVREFAAREEARIEEAVGLPPDVQKALADLRENKPAEALEALEVIRGSNHPTVTAALTALLSSSLSADVRLAAAGCLGVARSSEAVPQLRTAAISDSAAAVRLEAALALAAIGTAEALAALEERKSARADDAFIDSVIGTYK